MLSKKGKYGLKAAVHLAGLPGGQSAQVAALQRSDDLMHVLGFVREFAEIVVVDLDDGSRAHSILLSTVR